MIQVAQQVKGPDSTPSRNFSLFGQESNGSTWDQCRMNMFIREMDSARIEWCDTITNPQLIEDDRLMRFNVVVANPPFSLDKWGAGLAAKEKFKRFLRGTPPKSKGDFAFITHMIEIALEDDGRVGVIVPNGVLFRGGSEGTIRQKLIEENLLDAVIGLPTNLFFGTGIQAAILVFRKGRRRTDVLFLDASREYQDDKRQNRLTDANTDKIVAAYEAYESVPKFAHRATLDEIRENEFNLNIPRYVDTTEQEADIDVAALQEEIDSLAQQLAATRAEMARYLKELGFTKGGGRP